MTRRREGNERRALDDVLHDEDDAVGDSSDDGGEGAATSREGR